jgi:hypothetical protein
MDLKDHLLQVLTVEQAQVVLLLLGTLAVVVAVEVMIMLLLV